MTPSCFAISRKFSGALLKCWVDVREITFKIGDFRQPRQDFVLHAFREIGVVWSSLRLSNGRTAIDFCGMSISNARCGCFAPSGVASEKE